MIWIAEIPIVTIALFAILAGNWIECIQTDIILQLLGTILFIIGMDLSIVAFSEVEESPAQWKQAKRTAFFILHGAAVLLISALFG